MSVSATACSLINPICIQKIHLPLITSSDILPHACAVVVAVGVRGSLNTASLSSHLAMSARGAKDLTHSCVCDSTTQPIRHSEKCRLLSSKLWRPNLPWKPALRISQRLRTRPLATWHKQWNSTLSYYVHGNLSRGNFHNHCFAISNRRTHTHTHTHHTQVIWEPRSGQWRQVVNSIKPSTCES